ncbi:hypothetical protein [Sebaldella sp. S0638]|uniref:hypothetical protein n=1 Tax=Sebaldella sp. S0638 TaxID=2957809 RepID=UPI00209C8BA6|nr:hypothetical protein [Sebaldella sp. S0638]MCP1226639.1 hypothetical protein [Sebaldella sp. S0638]
MTLETLTTQLNQLNTRFDEINTMNALTPEEQWRKGMMLQQIGRELKKLRKKLI